jgi:peptidoglycan/LPS O-acetylase OafA/YrhL
VKLAYRRDIDGLRAVAVLAVVIYHFNKNWLPGGFLGVDMFFVISGFLITSIIFNEINTQQFSFKHFYLRRIKRIIPASLFFVTITISVSYLLFLPTDFDRAAKSAIATLVFASNFYFARNVDYFASASEENPFLHTWSLSVEEQFYLFWPVLLLLIYRSELSFKWKNSFIVILSIASFVIATYWAMEPSTQKWAFYMLPARFGELLIGAVGAVMLTKSNTHQHWGKTCNLLGLGVIVASFVLISETSIFPGVLAIPVCFGTLLMIIGGQLTNKRPSIISLVLSSAPAVYIGAISYSLYLAHWPVLAFQRYISQQYELSFISAILCLLIMWVLAHFSWRCIETPFRTQKLSFTKAFTLIFAVPSALLLAICTFIVVQQGLPSRFDFDYKSFSVAEKSLCHTHISEPCLIGNKDNLKPYLLVGDSHAGHYLSYFDALGQRENFGMEGRSVDGCSGVFTQQILTPKMARLNDCTNIKNYIKQTSDAYSYIIIAERWDTRVLIQNNYLLLLERYLKDMEQNKVQIVLLAQVPKYLCDVNRSAMLEKRVSWAKQCNFELDERYVEANNIIYSLAKKYNNVQFFSLNDILCEDQCSPYLNGQIAYKDDDHLNIIGAQKLAELSPTNFLKIVD